MKEPFFLIKYYEILTNQCFVFTSGRSDSVTGSTVSEHCSGVVVWQLGLHRSRTLAHSGRHSCVTGAVNRAVAAIVPSPVQSGVLARLLRLRVVPARSGHHG